MGVFKQMKDMKDMVNAAPDMIDQANAMSAQAQQMAAAQQAAAAQGAGVAQGATAVNPADLEPIDGVTIEQYANISKIAANRGVDEAGLGAIATERGIDPETYANASKAWNDRMKGNMPLATHFGTLYTQATGA